MAGFGKKTGGSGINGAPPSSQPIPLNPSSPDAVTDADLDPQPATPAWKGPLSRVAMIGGAAVIATVSWFSLQAGASTANPEAKRRIEATLAVNPKLARLYAAFEQYRPAGYRELMQRTSGALSRGDAVAASYRAFAFARPIFDSDAATLDRADEASLAAWFAAASATVSRVQTLSPTLCGKLLLKGHAEEFPDDPEASFAANEWIAVTIEAAHSSEASARVYQAPSRDDGITMAQLLMAQNLSIEDIKSLGGEDALAKLPDDQRCPALLRMTRTILNAPEPTRSRFLGLAAVSAAKRAAELSR